MRPLAATNAASTRRDGGQPAGAMRCSAREWDAAALKGQIAEDMAFYTRITTVEDALLREATMRALDTLAQALRLYGPERTVVSFNGGKDADVVLHLARAASAKYCTDNDVLERPSLVYFEDPKEFPEVEDHVRRAVEAHKFDMIRFDTGVKAGLADLVGRSERTLAFVLGTRRGDPNCGNQGDFAPSSSYMPPFMRVNPVIEWTYGQIWQFIELHDIAVCPLYQQGYTSLGKIDNTLKNPALALPDGSYLPASHLRDWGLERLGRATQHKETSAAEPSPSAPQPDAQEGGGGEVGVESFSNACEVTERLQAASNVGLIIIGDEVLLGKVSEENSKYAVEQFRKRGLALRRISVVPDAEVEIAREIRRQSAACDLVVTSGGIGPTHDDVTLKAVASAFHTVH